MKMPRHCSIGVHVKTKLLLPSLSPSFSFKSLLRTLYTFSNTTTTTLVPTPPPSHPRYFSLYQTLVPRHFSTSNLRPDVARRFDSSFVVAKCISSITPAGTLEWNEPIMCSQVGSGDDVGGVSEEDTKASIPVRAFFFSTRFGS